MTKYYRRMMKYFEKNPVFAHVIHIMTGVGLGIMLARPFDGGHPIRWGVILLAGALAGHLWAAKR